MKNKNINENIENLTNNRKTKISERYDLFLVPSYDTMITWSHNPQSRLISDHGKLEEGRKECAIMETCPKTLALLE